MPISMDRLPNEESGRAVDTVVALDLLKSEADLLSKAELSLCVSLLSHIQAGRESTGVVPLSALLDTLETHAPVLGVRLTWPRH